MRKLFLTATLMVVAVSAQNPTLADGVYAVEDVGAKAKDAVIRRFEGKDVILDRAVFAPLLVEGKPEVNRDPRGSSLMVQLAPEAAKRLDDLTRSHMGRPIAVVVGDRVLSTPTVRSVIKDGKARVTPCDDEGCEALLRRLTK